MLPYALVSAWERSLAVRLHDPALHITGATLAAHSLLGMLPLRPAGEEGHQRVWTPRPCSSGAREFVHTFQVLWAAGDRQPHEWGRPPFLSAGAGFILHRHLVH